MTRREKLAAIFRLADEARLTVGYLVAHIEAWRRDGGSGIESYVNDLYRELTTADDDESDPCAGQKAAVEAAKAALVKAQAALEVVS